MKVICKKPMPGVEVFEQKIFSDTRGHVGHIVRSDSPSFPKFAECYYSCVNYGQVKGWKKHTEITLNICVVSGSIKFVVCDFDTKHKIIRNQYEVILSKDNHNRIVINPFLWMAFQGVGKSENVLVNCINQFHSTSEAHRLPLESVPYEW